MVVVVEVRARVEVHVEFSALPGRDDRGGRMGAVEGGPAETLAELVVAVRVLRLYRVAKTEVVGWEPVKEAPPRPTSNSRVAPGHAWVAGVGSVLVAAALPALSRRAC